MRAAVITLHTVCNYGTALQVYATQIKLREYFDEVVFIDYRRKDTYGIGLVNTFAKGNFLKGLAVLPTIWYWRHIFGGFLKKYIHRTQEVYLKDADFLHFTDAADIYFSGSDQVWNTGWNQGVLAPYYLSFVPDGKPKYAYASSFGMERLKQAQVDASIGYIQQFYKISVREKSGISILKEQYGYENVRQILDPTLALTADFWRRHASYRRTERIKGKYILIYNLNRSREFDTYAEKLSRKTGYGLYRLCTRFDQIFRNGKSIVIPEIFEFVALIDKAEMVLTDSFHATAFSMNLNTEPICIYPPNYAGRISEFLEMLGEERRHVKDYTDFDVVHRHVDFAHVNQILMEERKKVNEFLQEVRDETERKM